MKAVHPRQVIFLALAATFLFGVLSSTQTASAFDCAAGPAVAPLERLDAALVGIPVERLGSLGQFDVIRFEVVEPAKGSMDDEAVLLVDAVGWDGYHEASLIPDGERFGKEAGLQLYDLSAPIVAESCTTTHPNYVREAAQALPQPDVQVEVEAISVGRDVGTTHRLTGESGRIAAYVAGDEELYHARFCADGVTLVETYRSPEGAFLRWRNMTTLEVLAEERVPDPRPFGATIVVSCVDEHRVLLRTSDPHIVMDPDGTLVRTVEDMFSGRITSVAMSNDGQTVAAIVDQARLSVGDVDGVAAELDVVGRVLSNVALSPDGERIAFLRGGDKQRMVVVDRAGNEQMVVIEPGYGNAQVINWLDDETITTGGWTTTHTSFGGETAEVNAYDLATLVDSELGYVDPPTNRTAVETDDGPAILDLRSGELTSLGGLRPRGIVVAAPEPFAVAAPGWSPTETEFPLPGERVPATLDELVEVLRQNPERFADKAALDALIAQPTAAGEPERVATARDFGTREPVDNSFPWRESAFVVGLVVSVVGVSIWRTKRSIAK